MPRILEQPRSPAEHDRIDKQPVFVHNACGDKAVDHRDAARDADLPAGLLSAGQKRRLALARLLVATRPIWLLDEPQTSLDKASLKLLDAAIEHHLATGGIAVVASHAQLGAKLAKQLSLGKERVS